VLRPPREDRLGEDVVVDLVVRLGPVDRPDGPDDPVARAGELLENASQLFLRLLHPVRERRGRERDLGPARRHEVLEGACGKLPLTLAQLRHAVLEVGPDDRLGLSELLERLAP
jgi:hypothetical protein